MPSPDPKESVSPDETALIDAAVQLVRDDKAELALRWTYLSDWPSDFSADAAAAAWGMPGNLEAVQQDLSELEKRGLIEFDRTTARYKLSELMKRVAAGLFG